ASRHANIVGRSQQWNGPPWQSGPRADPASVPESGSSVRQGVFESAMDGRPDPSLAGPADSRQTTGSASWRRVNQKDDCQPPGPGADTCQTATAYEGLTSWDVSTSRN